MKYKQDEHIGFPAKEPLIPTIEDWIRSRHYDYDPTGIDPKNRKVSKDVITQINGKDYKYIIIPSGPFYGDSIKVTHIEKQIELIKDVDFITTHYVNNLTKKLNNGKEVFLTITFLDKNISGNVITDYQIVGGDYVTDTWLLQQDAVDLLGEDQTIYWSNVTNKPEKYNPKLHTHDWETDFYDTDELSRAIWDVVDTFEKGNHTHEMSDIVDLSKIIMSCVNNKGMIKRDICHPLVVQGHTGPIEFALPVLDANVKVNIHSTIKILNDGNKTVLRFVGEFHNDLSQPNWLTCSLYMYGNQFNIPVYVGVNDYGAPAIYIGNQDTNWIGWGTIWFDVINVTVTAENKQIIKNSYGLDISRADMTNNTIVPVKTITDVPFNNSVTVKNLDIVYDEVLELLTIAVNGVSDSTRITQFDGSWIQPILDEMQISNTECKRAVLANLDRINELRILISQNKILIADNLVLINKNIDDLLKIKIRIDINDANCEANKVLIDQNVIDILNVRNLCHINLVALSSNRNDIQRNENTIINLTPIINSNTYTILNNYNQINRNIIDITNIKATITNLDNIVNQNQQNIDSNIINNQTNFNQISKNNTDLNNLVIDNNNVMADWGNKYNDILSKISYMKGNFTYSVGPCGWVRFPSGVTVAWSIGYVNRLPVSMYPIYWDMAFSHDITSCWARGVVTSSTGYGGLVNGSLEQYLPNKFNIILGIGRT